ncbi:hypothetical protein [Ochrobactrum chromiisoli]|uniref:Uncharacterized protein n=1 Tax=Ochrobactrum chromiisoli TaxID=2993941 RepID=A0ABT3QKT4_9HYPH|nr:hypothetical protein [Ochrobactrum chromiisoli]MCX2696225.1 hypothetical protein [Ochrobactrum chromiisoli]
MTNELSEPRITFIDEDGSTVEKSELDGRVLYRLTTYKSAESQKLEIEQPKYIVEKALVLTYKSSCWQSWADLEKEFINEIYQKYIAHNEIKGDLYELVFSSSDKNYSFKSPTGLMIPADLGLLQEIDDFLKVSHKDVYENWTLKHNFDCISVSKDAPPSKPRIGEKDPGINPIDIKTVPENLRFMCTEGFKDQARQFYDALNRIFPSSDRAWVRKYYVEKLDTWSHIARADKAIGGLIKDTMSTIAENPHFPTWWKSFGVCLMRGNPQGVIDSCQRVINYNGDKKVFIEKESDHDSSTMAY